MDRSVTSTGGPLILINKPTARQWRGIGGLSTSSQDKEAIFSNDYERACSFRAYLSKIHVDAGSALILGDMPLETFAWNVNFRKALIVRPIYKPSDKSVRSFDLEKGLVDSRPVQEAVYFETVDDDYVIFGASEVGEEATGSFLNLKLERDGYIINTFVIQPDDQATLGRVDGLAKVV